MYSGFNEFYFLDVCVKDKEINSTPLLPCPKCGHIPDTNDPDFSTRSPEAVRCIALIAGMVAMIVAIPTNEFQCVKGVGHKDCYDKWVSGKNDQATS